MEHKLINASKPFNILYPLPVIIETLSDEMTNLNVIKFIKLSKLELEQLWGAKLRKETREDGSTVTHLIYTNENAPFHKYIAQLGHLGFEIIEWQWWMSYVPDEVYDDSEQVYVAACLKIYSNFSVDLVVNFLFTQASSAWTLNTAPTDKMMQIRFATLNSLPVIDDYEGLLDALNKINEDKTTLSRQLNFASSNLKQLNNDAFVAEMICILERLYGHDTESSYRFRLNIMLGNPELANESNWKLLKRSYHLRSRYLHGGDVRVADKLTQEELLGLENLSQILLKKYLGTNIEVIQSNHTDDILIQKLKY